MSKEELEAKRAELASFRRVAIPVFATSALVSLVFMLNALAGRAFDFPPLLRTLIAPAFFVMMLASIPLALKQGRLVKEIKKLENR